MKRLALIALLPLASAAFADDAPTLAELAAANQACQSHRLAAPSDPRAPPQINGYEDGWSHCNLIELKYGQALKAADAADEATNPDLKTTRDVARKLGVQP